MPQALVPIMFREADLGRLREAADVAGPFDRTDLDGLRGALALALALALPPVPERTAIILTTFIVVAFSLFVQGLTMPKLVRRLGIECGVNDQEGRCSG